MNGTKKNYALVYFCTQNLFPRLISSLKKQIEHYPESRKFPAYLVTDKKQTDTPDIIFTSFKDIFYFDPWVKEGESNFFSFSALRNFAIDKAIELNLDGYLFCDSDTIIKHLEIFPTVDFGTPLLYWQRSAEETIKESDEIVSSGEPCFSGSNSWFYVSRNVISEFRFNEKIYGYGYEDIDFYNRVNAKYPLNQNTLGIIIHNFHASEERKIDPDKYHANRLIMELTAKLISSGVNISSQPVSAFRAIHPHWEYDMIFVYDDMRFSRPDVGDGGTFHEVDGVFYLTWDNSQWGTELFFRIGNVLRFQPDNHIK